MTRVHAPRQVDVYPDGTILCYVTGIELGQGLYTKCAQVAAMILGLPDTSLIEIQCTSTGATPNGGGTYGSMASGANAWGPPPPPLRFRTTSPLSVLGRGHAPLLTTLLDTCHLRPCLTLCHPRRRDGAGVQGSQGQARSHRAHARGRRRPAARVDEAGARRRAPWTPVMSPIGNCTLDHVAVALHIDLSWGLPLSRLVSIEVPSTDLWQSFL